MVYAAWKVPAILATPLRVGGAFRFAREGALLRSTRKDIQLLLIVREVMSKDVGDRASWKFPALEADCVA